MSYLNFNWHNFETGWNFYMQFLAKVFALAALSVYSHSIETAKILSFDL